DVETRRRLLRARRPDVDPQVRELGRFFAIVRAQQMDRLFPHDAEHIALGAGKSNALADEHLHVPTADRRDVDVPIVVHVLHDDADLIDVACEHDGRAAAAFDGRHAVAVDVAPYGGEARRFLAPEAGGCRLEARRAGRIQQALEKGHCGGRQHRDRVVPFGERSCPVRRLTPPARRVRTTQYARPDPPSVRPGRWAVGRIRRCVRRRTRTRNRRATTITAAAITTAGIMSPALHAAVARAPDRHKKYRAAHNSDARTFVVAPQGGHIATPSAPSPRGHPMRLPMCLAILAASFGWVSIAPAQSARSAASAATSAPVSNIAYRVTFDSSDARRRVLHVDMSFNVDGGDAPVILALPAWTPGSYELDYFARAVLRFGAASAGHDLQWDKVDYDTWRVRPAGSKSITVSFDYLADTLDNAMAWARSDFVMFNGTNVFLYPEGRSFDFPSTVTIRTEPAWRVITGMTPG